MSELKPVKKAELARHWHVSPPYVTKISRPIAEGGKAMPEFVTLAEADNWRAVHAPPKNPRPSGQGLGENLTVASKKNVGSPVTTTARTPPQGGTVTTTPTTAPRNVDVESFIRRDTDFDSLMIEQAEHVPQMAYGLFRLACSGANSAEISAAAKNWHEAAKASASVRGGFLELQEKNRALLPLDEVMDILGIELQAVRVAFLKAGERIASAANPADPALAQRIIDAYIEKILAQLDFVEARTAKELAPPASVASPAPPAPPVAVDPAPELALAVADPAAPPPPAP